MNGNRAFVARALKVSSKWKTAYQKKKIQNNAKLLKEKNKDW